MFQFTQPKRAATQSTLGLKHGGHVSIHAAQAGCDHDIFFRSIVLNRFNSRSPSGLRLGFRFDGDRT